MNSTPTPAVTLVPVAPGQPDTSPPASPWELAARRLWVQLFPLLPITINILIDFIQQGQIKVDPQWVVPITIAIMAYQTYLKQRKEQQRQDTSMALEATHGLPMGRSFSADRMRELLTTEATLPSRPMPVPTTTTTKE
jgi:hypothetical protein